MLTGSLLELEVTLRWVDCDPIASGGNDGGVCVEVEGCDDVAADFLRYRRFGGGLYSSNFGMPWLKRNLSMSNCDGLFLLLLIIL